MNLGDLLPESDQEATFLSGLVMLMLGFGVAQLLGSILYLPLSLIVPGAILTVIGVLAHPTEGPE